MTDLATLPPMAGDRLDAGGGGSRGQLARGEQLPQMLKQPQHRQLSILGTAGWLV